jgi:hypothetical protein
LEKLAQDIDAGIRASVAGHPSLAVTALEKLATDDEVAVRAAVALNPKTPIKVLQSLSVDPFLGVRWCVAGHAAQQPDFRDRFVNWWFDRLQRALDRESRVRAGEVPEAVNRIQPVDILRALHRLGLVPPTDDNKALTQASRSKDWLTRLGVALHPGASEGILKILRKDADPDVARAATSRCS